MTEEDRYRLPRAVLPRHYHLSIAADLAACTFEGTTEIEVDVREPVTSLTCNAADLDIHSAVVIDAAGAEQVGSVALDPETERVTVSLPAELAPGPGRVTFTQSGRLNDKLQGFYRSTFVDGAGEAHTIATTQFEATDARRAFPCWDEPDAKATFDIELLVPDGMIAISNSAIQSERPAADGGRWVKFARTMVMSTYLAAWVIGPLELTETVDVDGVPMRVACPPGRSHLASFALEAGAHAVRYFTEYFGIPYPGDKLDFVAIPDFAFGAMENLGCVTFRENAVLIDPATASRQELARVVDVICHEVAHMWFGDLVTMKWWNGIWLNEAFATFMELKCSDAFRPEWERWVEFSESRATAMTVDGLSSTRPVEFPVVSPDDAEGMFDVLTYEKGGAVLRMLETYLGTDRFRDGIRQYLRAHSYGNTETTDLWDAIEASTGEPVRSIMDTWIFQGGLPEISVDGDHGTLRLQQRRFRYLPADDAATWQVPVLLRIASGGAWSRQRLLLTDGAATVALPDAVDAIVVNDGGWGFFRTRYSEPLFERLADNLGSLSAIERFNLVSDTWGSVLAGTTPFADFLSLASRLDAETDEVVWEALLGPLDQLDRIVTNADQPVLGSFIVALAQPQFERLGWQPTPEDGTRVGTLRATLLTALGTIGADSSVQKRAVELHRAFVEDRRAVPPDLVGALIEVLAWTGGEAEYDLCWERYRNAPTPQEEMRYLYALPKFPQPALMDRTLSLALTEIRSQNAPFVVGTALTNRASGRIAWEWLKSNWDDVLRRFPDSTVWRMLEGLAALTGPDLVDDVHAFMAAHPVPNAHLLIQQTLERLDVAARFRQREAATLGDVLRRFVG